MKPIKEGGVSSSCGIKDNRKNLKSQSIPHDQYVKRLLKIRYFSLAGVAQWIEHRLRTKGSPVRFPVRAHAWVAGRSPVRATREAPTH